MFFRFSTNKCMTDLVKEIKAEGMLKTKRIEDAFISVDRNDFLPSTNKTIIYADNAFSLGYGATISAPHMHAHVLDLLEPVLKPGNKCLDIGSGSGILCTLMMKLVGPNGKVIGVEHISKLVEQSITNIKKYFKKEYEQGIIKIIEGDGRSGYKAEAPYDCIHVGAAMDSLDDQLLKQLNKNGIMIAPVKSEDGYGYQDLTVIKKDSEGKITKEKVTAVMFVPLISKNKQISMP